MITVWSNLYWKGFRNISESKFPREALKSGGKGPKSESMIFSDVYYQNGFYTYQNYANLAGPPIFLIAWGFLTEVTSGLLASPIIFNEMRKSEFQAFQTFEPKSKASSKTFEIMTLKITESFVIQEV